MAKRLDKQDIVSLNIVRPYHVSQSVDAFTGIEDYDINVSGSFQVTGSTTLSGSTYIKTLTELSTPNVLTINTTTGQLFYTASAAVGTPTNTGSLLTTASYSAPNIVFTKGNGTTFTIPLPSDIHIGNSNLSVPSSTTRILSIPDSSVVIFSGSFAQGINTLASGTGSHAEGFRSTASGHYSHAEGELTLAFGPVSHAEGIRTMTSASGSHSEGYLTTASGHYSHAEGGGYINDEGIIRYFKGGTSTAPGSHAEGGGTLSSGAASHAEGKYATSQGDFSHAEGELTLAYGYASHAEGVYATASGRYSHAEGGGLYEFFEGHWAYVNGGRAVGEGSHAEGGGTLASSSLSHAEGLFTTASGDFSHAEGSGSLASGKGSHAEGLLTTASGDYSHAEGGHYVEGRGGDWYPIKGGTTMGMGSHAEGLLTLASGNGSHAEGSQTTASGDYSHAEGRDSVTHGAWSHAEGHYTISSGSYSHAEGRDSLTIGDFSHVEGWYTTASGRYSHAEGYKTFAIGEASHAEGSGSVASGSYSHASGQNTVASGSFQTVVGSFNKHGDTTSRFIVGGGSSDLDRKDALIVTSNNYVGINQSTPGQQLEVNGTTQTQGLIIKSVGSGTKTTNLAVNSNGDVIGSSVGDVFFVSKQPEPIPPITTPTALQGIPAGQTITGFTTIRYNNTNGILTTPFGTFDNSTGVFTVSTSCILLLQAWVFLKAASPSTYWSTTSNGQIGLGITVDNPTDFYCGDYQTILQSITGHVNVSTSTIVHATLGTTFKLKVLNQTDRNYSGLAGDGIRMSFTRLD